MSIFGFLGTIDNPFNQLAPGTNLATSTQGEGLIALASNLFRLIIVVGGMYTLLNIVLAGYAFLSAGGKPENVRVAWNKIWQSILGLLIMVSSIVLASIIGWVLFGSQYWNILFKPQIFTP